MQISGLENSATFNASDVLAIEINEITYKLTGATLAAAILNKIGAGSLNASPSMLVNLASTSAANVMQASPRPGVTGVLPVARGGTGVTWQGIYSKVLTDGDSLTSRTLILPNAARLLIVHESSAISRCAALLVITYNTGAVYTMELSKGSGITFDTSVANRLTIDTDSAGNADIMLLSTRENVNNVDFV